MDNYTRRKILFQKYIGEYKLSLEGIFHCSVKREFATFTTEFERTQLERRHVLYIKERVPYDKSQCTNQSVSGECGVHITNILWVWIDLAHYV